LPSYPQGDLETPFLKEELFVGESEAGWEARVAALEAESPFQSALEQDQTTLIESKEMEAEMLAEELVEEGKQAVSAHFPVEQADSYSEEAEQSADLVDGLNAEKFSEEEDELEEVLTDEEEEESRAVDEILSGLDRAVSLNRRYGEELGWRIQDDTIARFLGFINYSPDEKTFAEAIARWQRSQSLKGDGILGPETWARLRAALPADNRERFPARSQPTSFIPTPVESPGGGRIKDLTEPSQAELVAVGGFGGRSIELHRLAAAAWTALVSAARSDGFGTPLLLPVSGYRSVKRQEVLWQEALRKYGSREEARKWVAPPGGSAHQTGRAIDFYLGGKNSSANAINLRKLAVHSWLLANAARFGFYPYEREPWHWEYNPPARASEREYETAVEPEFEEYEGYSGELDEEEAREEVFGQFITNYEGELEDEGSLAELGEERFDQEAEEEEPAEYFPNEREELEVEEFRAPWNQAELVYEVEAANEILSSLARRIQEALRIGQWSLALGLAILRGQRDENDLTNLVFYARHPELQGRRIGRDEKELAKEWLAIRDQLVRPALRLASSTGRTPVAAADAAAETQTAPIRRVIDKRTKKVKGYAAYGGGRLEKNLGELRLRGRITALNDADIDMLQRIANVEINGQIQGINSWDSAFMSMGFMQWTIKYTDNYNSNGKLQRLIERAPEAFRRHGIELATPTRYRIGEYSPVAIKGAEKPDDLRSFEWAKRFYAAGLDQDVIVEEAKLALEVIQEDKQRITRRVGIGFLPYYEKSAVLRALIQETFNNRPAYLYQALKRAVEHTKRMGEVSTDQFLERVREAIREVYREKEPEKGPQKAENLIRKTARLVL
jgi:hypothetical protein